MIELLSMLMMQVSFYPALFEPGNARPDRLYLPGMSPAPNFRDQATRSMVF
jgi:hypothetical protein